MTTTIIIKGLHCPACKKLTEKRIGSIPGVTSVDADPDSGNTRITSISEIPVVQVRAALSGTPYSVS
ncbi:hypothetical protein A2379_00900 [Candidatus Amesbacteria bacterium RIFOXYB1_FULL_47_13]|nr:MAG: hypothetical protein A2379_00900 [Candidatus Amesbacteria bacterium RIFOXYB1_FULL_47_13]HBC73017.1 cation-transporting ATPase [Candidatus Amesbacteria bacterium]